MKRKYLIIFFVFFSFICYSNETIDNLVFTNDFNLEHQDDYVFKQGDISICNYIFSIYSSGYKPYYDELGEIVLTNDVFVIKDNKLIKDFFTTYISENNFDNEILRKQIPHDIYKSTMVLSDFNYDGDVDILYLTGDSIYSYFYLKSIEGDEEIIFESNEFSHESMNHLSESKILFNDSLKFCIINKKRGFVIPYQIKNKQVITKFYYWSASEQRYIPDETVTQEQIKNANCPEDYFAYNGLKFSKLDSKLTEEDLKELDKAQLRIMRNAVYARHGRTFKSVDLQSLWECYTWYQKNPNYNDSLLSEKDKYNINLIQKYESK